MIERGKSTGENAPKPHSNPGKTRMSDLAMALFLAVIAAGIGKRLLDWLGECPNYPLDTLALAAPLGLGILALTALLIGEAGWLNLVGLAVLLGVATELGVLAGARLVAALVREMRTPADGSPNTWLDRILGLCLVLVVGATVLAALAPVTDGDALCYHLQVPKIFLVRQALYFDPDLHETIYPLVTELLYAIALEFRGPVACRCVHWVLGLVFAANVAALARPTLGQRAWWAATFAVLVPAINNGMAAPLNDVSLAAFGAAAIFAWVRAIDRATLSSTALAGVCSGVVMGVKYPALVLVGLLFLAILCRPLLDCCHRNPKGIARALGLAAGFLATALVVGGGWYLRAYVHTGNPVFPFFKGFFGGAGLEEVLAPIKRPLPTEPWALLSAIVPLTLEPQRFDSFSHQFGPLFLLFLPALFLERPPRRVLGLAGLGYAFLLLCMTQRQSMRFLLIALGPMSVGIAYLTHRWSDRRSIPARAVIVLLMLMLSMEAGIALVRAGRVAGTVLGPESFQHWLGRSEPTYRVGRWIDKNLPRTARLIGQDHRGFYIPRDYTMELAHRRRTGLGSNRESAPEIVETLKNEGYTHLMLCPPDQQGEIEFDSTLSKLLAPWLTDHPPVYREDLADPGGVVRHYAIYSLGHAECTAESKGNQSLTR
jgi:hypothetical protein